MLIGQFYYDIHWARLYKISSIPRRHSVFHNLDAWAGVGFLTAISIVMVWDAAEIFLMDTMLSRPLYVRLFGLVKAPKEVLLAVPG